MINISKLIDLTGCAFGYLTVIKRIENRVYPSGSVEPQYLCKCVCGKEVVKEGRSLRNAKNKLHCGCMYKHSYNEGEDLVGQRFGHLLVTSKAKEADEWNCLCECGNEKRFSTKQLKYGRNKSCGCLAQPFKNLSGQKFGRLTVLYRDKNDKTGHTKWICRCDCGKNVSVYRDALLDGRQVSCGCHKAELLQSEEYSESRRNLNQYDLSGMYGIGYCSNSGKEFYFDKEDYDLIKKYTWRDDKNGYIVASTNKNHDNVCSVFLHRIVMGLEDNELQVDHVGHNTYDNRKEYLRIVTRSENESNRAIMKNNKSGVPGVWWDSKDNCWLAYIGKNNKRIKLGSFSDFNEAVSARKIAEEKYFGEHSYDNSINMYNNQTKNNQVENIGLI